jgi:hypothetical protein
VYSVLAVISLILVHRVPNPETQQEWDLWIGTTSNRRALFLALSLASVASVAFLWFVAVVRRRIGDREDRFFGTVFFGSAMVHIALWLVSIAAISSLAIGGARGDGQTNIDVVGYGRGLSSALLLVAGPRIQAVFVASTSTMFLRTRAVPTWLAYFGYGLAGVMFLIPIVASPLGLGLPMFVLVSSIVILFVGELQSPHDQSSESVT